MSYAKIEPTGCAIFKGKIQLRICFYLEPTDPRYTEYHVYVVDTTSVAWLKGYKGKVDEVGGAVSPVAYKAWIDSLPHIWQDNPFHNHFIYVDTTLTDTVLKQQITSWLTEFYTVWKAGKDILDYWNTRPNKPVFSAGSLSPENILKSQSGLVDILSKVTTFEVKVSQ